MPLALLWVLGSSVLSVTRLKVFVTSSSLPSFSLSLSLYCAAATAIAAAAAYPCGIFHFCTAQKPHISPIKTLFSPFAIHPQPT